MKRFFIGTTILSGLIILLIIIARLTNALQVYHIVSSSMSPAIEPDDYVFSTNLVKHKRNDIIVFTRETDMFDGDAAPGSTARFTYRLIAMSGEKLELRNGVAYVNDKLSDDSTKLKFYYTFDADKTTAVQAALNIDQNHLQENEWMVNPHSNTVALLSYPQYAIAQKITPLIKFRELPDTSLYKNSSTKNWTLNDYGPVYIPSGYYFLLGDNRCGARDSRFIGPIKKESVTGVVISR